MAQRKDGRTEEAPVRLVVDSNILITFFWPDSVFRFVAENHIAELVAPSYALKEINAHAQEIERRARVQDFEGLLSRLSLFVHFIPESYYLEELRHERWIHMLTVRTSSAIIEDIDFLALAHKLDCLLWSNDALLKRQDSVRVLNTAEIVEILKAFGEM